MRKERPRYPKTPWPFKNCYGTFSVTENARPRRSIQWAALGAREGLACNGADEAGILALGFADSLHTRKNKTSDCQGQH